MLARYFYRPSLRARIAYWLFVLEGPRCAWCDRLTLSHCLYCGRPTCDECRVPCLDGRYCSPCYTKEVVEAR